MKTKPKKKLKATMWAIVFRGCVLHGKAYSKKSTAIDYVTSGGLFGSWKYLYSRGYRAVKVKVEEI